MTEYEMMWKLVLALSVLLGIAVAVKKVFFSTKLPQPFEVKAADDFMTRRECNASHLTFDFRLTAVERRMDGIIADVKQDIGELHRKVNESEKASSSRHSEVMRAIGRLEGS